LQITARRFGISSILKHSTPNEYNDKYYWLKNTSGNMYAFGITDQFLEEYGYPQMIFYESEIDDVLMEGDPFAVIENEKAVVTLDTPFDNAKLVYLDEDIDFDIVNEDPSNLDNKICVFEDVNNTESSFSGDDVPVQLSML
jgi:glycine cleavage system H lipoate-binding protein